MRWLTLVVAGLMASPAAAAPLAQIGCITADWTTAQRLQMLDAFADDPTIPQDRVALARANFMHAVERCTALYHWTDNESQSAMRFAVEDNLLHFQRWMARNVSLDLAPIDAYFASNRDALVAGPDGEPDAWEAHIKTALRGTGFPVDNAESMDSGLSYLGVIILAERIKLRFVSGDSPD